MIVPMVKILKIDFSFNKDMYWTKKEFDWTKIFEIEKFFIC